MLKFSLAYLQIAGWFLFGGALSVAAESRTSFTFHEPGTFKVDGRKFNLRSEKQTAKFRVFTTNLLQRAVNARGEISKKDARGLRALIRFSELREQETSSSERARLQSAMLEIASAIAANHRPIVPRYVGLPDLPFRFIDSLSNPVGKGRAPAVNLDVYDPDSELSLLDPVRSTFWRRPDSIDSADLANGFGRDCVPDYTVPRWSYAGPKTSGGNPGCELVGGSLRIKVKFAETHCEPFISRVFHALGYYVEPTDYAPRLRMKYDRRFFGEINSLPEIKMKIGLFFVPIHTFHFERVYDAFDFVEGAVLSDGTTCSRAELELLLLHDPKRKDRFADENFNQDAEASIDYLITTEANVQVEDRRERSIGPWDFSGLGHEHLRELRGAGVLAAWLGWWDARFENTRLRLVETSAGPELRHYFSDLGAGLGSAAGTYRHSSERTNDFASTFTRMVRRRGEWRIEFPGYEPIEDNGAFKEITLDDARWMARLIGQLSETQISGALAASGFDAEEVRIYTEKLILRRDQLLRDTQQTSEYPLLR